MDEAGGGNLKAPKGEDEEEDPAIGAVFGVSASRLVSYRIGEMLIGSLPASSEGLGVPVPLPNASTSSILRVRGRIDGVSRDAALNRRTASVSCGE